MSASTLPHCILCCRTVKGARPRCHTCVKGNWPAPGSPAWSRWVKGLVRTMGARCMAKGVPASAQSAALACMMLGDGPMPPEVAPLIPDILAMPTSLVAYNELVDRAVVRAQVYGTLCREGVDPAMAERLSTEAADWSLARRRARRMRIDALPVNGLRFAPVAEDDTAAEAEAQAVDEALADRARVFALIAMRPAEKQASRVRDAADLASGAKTPDELHRENAALAGLPVRIDWKNAKELG